MGGGGAMRAAAKVAGIGVYNGVRGGLSTVPSPAEQTVRNASRPAVSAIISSSQGGGGLEAAPAVQKPAWEVDDWEFAGGVEEELAVGAGKAAAVAEPMPRVVFGSAPSLQEAKEATNDLKEAIEKVFLSSTSHTESGIAIGVCQRSGVSLLASSDNLETNSCITADPKATPVPKYAMKAFSMLKESPAVQTVVASIAQDQNVWDAVLNNQAFREYLETNTGENKDLGFGFRYAENKDLGSGFSYAENEDLGSPRKFAEISDSGSKTGNSKPMDILENIKVKVAEMVSNVSSFLQSIFNHASAGNVYGNNPPSFVDKTLGASFMALAIMVIMVVVFKRA